MAPHTIQAIAVGCMPKQHGKPLLLKTPHVLVSGHEEVKLDLSRIFSSILATTHSARKCYAGYEELSPKVLLSYGSYPHTRYDMQIIMDTICYFLINLRFMLIAPKPGPVRQEKNLWLVKSRVPRVEATANVLLEQYDVPIKLPSKHLCLCLYIFAAVGHTERKLLFTMGDSHSRGS